MTYWLLQVMSDNCFAQIHKNRPDGTKYAEWALDSMIELFQRRYKRMLFKNDTNSWMKHLRNMPMLNWWIIHVDTEYSRCNGVYSMDEYNEGKPDGASTDKGNKKKLLVPPKRESEKKLIAEILSKASVFVKTPGWKMHLDCL